LVKIERNLCGSLGDCGEGAWTIRTYQKAKAVVVTDGIIPTLSSDRHYFHPLSNMCW